MGGLRHAWVRCLLHVVVVAAAVVVAYLIAYRVSVGPGPVDDSDAEVAFVQSAPLTVGVGGVAVLA